MSRIDSRIKLKRTSIIGATPSIGPSINHRDGTWAINDIYPGELFLNDQDGRLWVGTTTGTIEVTLGSTSGAADNPFTYGSTSGGLLIYTAIEPSFGTNDALNPYSSILGGAANTIGS